MRNIKNEGEEEETKRVEKEEKKKVGREQEKIKWGREKCKKSEIYIGRKWRVEGKFEFEI